MGEVKKMYSNRKKMYVSRMLRDGFLKTGFIQTCSVEYKELLKVFEWETSVLQVRIYEINLKLFVEF